MKLQGIMPIYNQMRRNKIFRYKFAYTVNKVEFDIFFFIDSSPYVILFGSKLTNFSFSIELEQGFLIRSTKLSEKDYNTLCKLLGLTYDPNNPFSTNKFFSEFNLKIPEYIHIQANVLPEHIAKYVTLAEETDKIYFCGWLDNNKRNNHVQSSNLEKTRKLLGESAYKTCQEKNISSCWTDNKHKSIHFELPDTELPDTK